MKNSASTRDVPAIKNGKDSNNLSRELMDYGPSVIDALETNQFILKK